MPILQFIIGIVVAIVVISTLLGAVNLGATETALLGLVTIVLAAAGIVTATRAM
jgi:hypothetical protein